MTTEEIKTGTLQEEAAVTPTPNGTQGEQARQDQPTADQNSKPSNPVQAPATNSLKYDGSYQPRVVEKNLTTAKAIRNALKRVEIRYNYLKDARVTCVNTIKEDSNDILDRIAAKNDLKEIKEQFEDLTKIREKIDGIIEGFKAEFSTEFEDFDPDTDFPMEF